MTFVDEQQTRGCLSNSTSPKLKTALVHKKPTVCTACVVFQPNDRQTKEVQLRSRSNKEWWELIRDGVKRSDPELFPVASEKQTDEQR